MDGDQPSTSGVTFALEDEDHTLANALRFLLNKNPCVEFCGYSIPHPSEAVVNVRVQTTGEITAIEALTQALEDLKRICSHLREKFVGAVEQSKAAPMEGVEGAT